MQYHVDGELIDRTAATISVTDRGFRFGDAAVETVRLFEGTLFQWAPHRTRLLDTCETLGIDAPPPAECTDRVQQVIEANDVRHGVVTVSITRGQQPGPVPPRTGGEPTVVVTIEDTSSPDATGSSDAADRATLQTVRTRRIPPDCLPGIDTTHNQLNTVIACRELQRMSRGESADDALVRNLNDRVVGGARGALFCVTDDGLHSPAPAATDAPGITRDLIRDLARAEDIPVHTESLDRDEVLDADEVFLGNSRWGIRPVETVDGIDRETGPVTELLAARYRTRLETVCR